MPPNYGRHSDLHYGLFASLLVRFADSRVGVDHQKFLLHHFTNGTKLSEYKYYMPDSESLDDFFAAAFAAASRAATICSQRKTNARAP